MLLIDVSASYTAIGNRRGRRNVKSLACFHSAITYWLTFLLNVSITTHIQRVYLHIQISEHIWKILRMHK